MKTNPTAAVRRKKAESCTHLSGLSVLCLRPETVVVSGDGVHCSAQRGACVCVCARSAAVRRGRVCAVWSREGSNCAVNVLWRQQGSLTCQSFVQPLLFLKNGSCGIRSAEDVVRVAEPGFRYWSSVEGSFICLRLNSTFQHRGKCFTWAKNHFKKRISDKNTIQIIYLKNLTPRKIQK